MSTIITVHKEDFMKPFFPKELQGIKEPFEVKFSFEPTFIPESFFSDTNLAKITLPDSITEIKSSAFSNCKFLEEINLPKNLKTIYSRAFLSSGIKKLIIPPSVKEIFACAFKSCSNLKKVTFPDSDIEFAANVFLDTPFLSQKQKENPLVVINNTLIDGTKALNNVCLPETVKKIAPRAFENSKMTSITFSESLEKVKSYAFANCNLNFVDNTKNSHALINHSAFFNATVKHDDELLIINNLLVDGKNYKEKVLKVENVKAIAVNAFYNNENIEEIIFSNPLALIGENAFSKCSNLKKITFPDSLMRIDSSAFDLTNISSFAFPPKMKDISLSIPLLCISLENIILPLNVENIRFTPVQAKTFNKMANLSIIIQQSQKSFFKTCKNADDFYNAFENKIIFDNTQSLDNIISESSSLDEMLEKIEEVESLDIL